MELLVTCGELGIEHVWASEVDIPQKRKISRKIYMLAGKIPGGYFKREARPTESETLISRLIDSP